MVALAIAGIVAVLVLLTFWAVRHRARPAASLTSVAVLPFENLSGDRGQDYFADGLTEELITSLGQISALQVVSHTSTSAYKARRVSISQMQHDLGVDAILEGSVQHDAHKVVIIVRLIDARKDRQVWSQRYSRELAGLLTVEGEMSQSLAQQVQVQVTASERQAFSQRSAVNESAQEEYLRALELIAAGKLEDARDHLERSVAADARYAQAHAALSLTYGGLGTRGTIASPVAYQQARREAVLAVSLDHTLAEAHVALAQSAADLDWNWAMEGTELRRALALNPSSTTALWRLAAHLLRFRDFDGATAAMKHSISLDPISSYVYVNAALLYYYAGQNDNALGMLSLAGNFPHNSKDLMFPLGVLLVEKGLLPQAIEQFTQYGSQAYGLGHLGYALALSHRTAEAEKTIAELRVSEQNTGQGTYEEAIVYAALGRKDEAFAALERAYLIHDKGVQYLRIDPCLKTLYSDARYMALVRKVGLIPPREDGTPSPT